MFASIARLGRGNRGVSDLCLALGTPVPSVPLSQPKLFDWPLFRMRIEMLPTPAAVTCLFAGQSSTMAPAAPRVLVRA